MKCFIKLLFTVILILESDASFSSSDMLLQADSMKLSFNYYKLNIQINKNNSDESLDSLIVSLGGKQLRIDKTILNKIVTPMLTEIQVSTPLVTQNYTIQIPFAYLNQTDNSANKVDYVGRENMLYISIDYNYYSVSAFLEEKNKRVTLVPRTQYY